MSLLTLYLISVFVSSAFICSTIYFYWSNGTDITYNTIIGGLLWALVPILNITIPIALLLISISINVIRKCDLIAIKGKEK